MKCFDIDGVMCDTYGYFIDVFKKEHGIDYSNNIVAMFEEEERTLEMYQHVERFVDIPMFEDAKTILNVLTDETVVFITARPARLNKAFLKTLEKNRVRKANYIIHNTYEALYNPEAVISKNDALSMYKNVEFFVDDMAHNLNVPDHVRDVYHLQRETMFGKRSKLPPRIAVISSLIEIVIQELNDVKVVPHGGYTREISPVQ